MARVLGARVKERESLQADGRRSQRQDYKECEFDRFLLRGGDFAIVSFAGVQEGLPSSDKRAGEINQTRSKNS